MATIIRLKRMGTKKRPFYRIVAIDSRKPSSAPYLDNLGYFNPIEKPGKITAHEDLIFKWLDTGAQMSDTVASLFKHRHHRASQKTQNEEKSGLTLIIEPILRLQKT